MSVFVKADRKQVKIKIAITGPSGAGKTMSALLIASGMGKRIAVVDTESGPAPLYADMDKGPLKGVKFDVLEPTPPYTIDKYVHAIEAAVAEKYDVCIVDSISPEWAGEGGLLSKKEALDQRGGNSYTNWASITKEHEIFKAKMLNADIHLIATARSKQDYILEVNDKGKQSPKKVGLAPIQRDGLEYDFTTVFDLAMDHNAAASKDRTAMFDGQIFKPTKKTGEQIMAWLAGGKPVESTKPAPACEQPEDEPAPAETDDPLGQPAQLTDAQAAEISRLIKSLIGPKRSEATIWKGIHQQITRNFAEVSELDTAEAAHLIDYLKRWLGHVQPQPPGAEA